MASLASGTLGLKNPNDMYVGMLRSRTVEDAMVQPYGLMAEYHKRYLSDAIKLFEQRSEVDGSNKDGLIHISLWDYDPVRAAKPEIQFQLSPRKGVQLVSSRRHNAECLCVPDNQANSHGYR